MKLDLPERITQKLECLSNIDLPDHEIYRAFKSAFGECSCQKERAVVQDVFDSFSYFYVDSSDTLLASMAKRAVRRLEGTRFKATLLENHQGNLDGVELSDTSKSRFAVFSEDASEPGRIRYTCFDERGFFGHTTRDTYEEALNEAWVDGYRAESYGVLANFAGTKAFADGIEHTHKIARVNQGEPWSSDSQYQVSQSKRQKR